MIYIGFFDDEYCNKVRSNSMSFTASWKMYRKYHHMHEPVTSKNAVDIMTDFRRIYDNLSCPTPLSPIDFQRYLNSFD